MKTLYLLRHAKSSWKDEAVMDIDRPLNKRGLINAPLMGIYYRKLKVKPQFIISSPAKRALSTAHIVAKKLDYAEKNIKIEMELYGANVEELVGIISKLQNSHNKVMLVGHNPAFTLAVSYLTDQNIDNLPTCGLAQIDLNIKKWDEVKEDCGILSKFEYPKKLVI